MVLTGNTLVTIHKSLANYGPDAHDLGFELMDSRYHPFVSDPQKKLMCLGHSGILVRFS